MGLPCACPLSRITMVSAASLEELGMFRSHGREAGTAKAASRLRKKQWPLLEKAEGPEQGHSRYFNLLTSKTACW